MKQDLTYKLSFIALLDSFCTIPVRNITYNNIFGRATVNFKPETITQMSMKNKTCREHRRRFKCQHTERNISIDVLTCVTSMCVSVGCTVGGCKHVELKDKNRT